ncbi:LytR/AlgR family response regulator transcription factor [Bacteroidota bacterium]
MNSKLNQYIRSIKEDLGLLLSISLGVFLFILFFQPFPLKNFDYNDMLLVLTGLGVIVFLAMLIVRVTYPRLFRSDENDDQYLMLNSFFQGFLILTLSSVAFAFYLRYVGIVNITFNIMFKVVLICLVPPVILSINDTMKFLQQQKISLMKEIEIIRKQVYKYEKEVMNKIIEITSENSTEKLKLLVVDVAYIKSADNYVEIVFRENDILRKKLIRNTLKNIEEQLKSYTNFMRCHRICIVNIHHIANLNKKYHNYWLSINEYDEQLPVSRQYILKFKEILEL